MTGRVIEDAWLDYECHVVPKDAGNTQRRQTRRAFYAGYASALGGLSALGEKDIPGAEGVESLAALHEECEQFARDIGSGKA